MKPEDKAVVQQALEALEDVVKNCWRDIPSWRLDEIKERITALRQLLEQPEPVQEPVGEVSGHDWSTGLLYRDLEPGTLLYTTPPAQPADQPDYEFHYRQLLEKYEALQSASKPADHGDELTIVYMDGVHTGKKMAKREWVGLTDEDLYAVRVPMSPEEIARAIEQRLKEKNT
jgi:hypothetical protein